MIMAKKAKKKHERNSVTKLAETPGSLTRRVESALARQEVDGACQLLSQARQQREAFSRELSASDRDLCARAYAAQAFARWDKPTQALDSLDRAIDLMPESAEIHRFRGNVLRRLGRTKLAVEALVEARRLAPEDQRIGLELLLTRMANGDRGADLVDQSSSLDGPMAGVALSLVAALRGDLSSAEGVASALQDPIGELQHAVFLLAQGQAVRAIPLLEKVAAREQSSGTAKACALFYLGVARVQRRELSLAADAVDKAQTLGVPAERVRVHLGWVCKHLAIDAVLGGDLAGAARWFGRLEKLGGPDAPAAGGNAALALTLMGQAAAKGEDYQGAITAWSQALATRPRDAALRQNLAIALERAGRTDEAITHWNELVRQIPREAKKDARQRVGGLAAMGEDEMLKHIRALAHQHLADLYLEEDEIDLAVEQLERALQLLPTDAEIRRNLAASLVEQGRFDKAIPHLERVVADAPGDAGRQLELGMALVAAGSEEAGVEHLEKSLALWPEHPLARFSLGMALARRTVKSPRAPNALADARRAVELLPAIGAFAGLLALGAAQLAQGDRRSADKTFNEAAKRTPDKADTLVKIGGAYWDAGETKAAVAAWTKAQKEAKKNPCAYADLVEEWAKAGDSGRCEECLAASMNHNEDEALEAIERVAKERELQPFLRQALHHVAAFTGDLIERAYLAQGLVYSGDMQGARTLLCSVARQAIEEDDDEVLGVVLSLDLKYKHKLLNSGTSEVVQDWLNANPGRL